MTAAWADELFLPGSVTEENGIRVARALPRRMSHQSFSQEWKEHAARELEKTWDYTASQRLEQFYLETQLDPDELKGKKLLDAGCGNGLLSRALADAGALVAAVDAQDALPGRLANASLVFVQADLRNLPFKENSFDIIIANGSLHHNPDTREAFLSVARLVKDGGKLYVWLYKRPVGAWRRFQLRLLDGCRFVISRLPLPLQRLKVNALTTIFYGLSRIRKGRNSRRSREEIRTNVYDAFTPRYRHYHRPEEVASWFHEAGFAPPVITHWDNQYGFGMVAAKVKQGRHVPGENFDN